MQKKTGGFRARDAILVAVAFGVLVSALVINVRFGDEALEVISSTGSTGGTSADFDSFWRSAKALWDGGDVYETGARLANLNPPFWVALIAPLGLLEPFTAYLVFALITLLTSVGYLAWTADELRLRAGWAVVAVVMLLLSSPLLATLVLGQIYPFLTLGLVAAWVADRRGRSGVAGSALGLVVIVKPSLLPLALWPLMRRRWGMLGTMLASAAAAMLVGIIMVGPRATLDWLKLLASAPLDGYWDNASLPGSAVRLFSENQYAEPIATLPWVIPAAYVLGIGIVILTAVKVRCDPEMGLWALVAASLLASPIAWNNYLVLLGPGVLLLLARGRAAPALLLLALQSIPPLWPLLWQGTNTVVATLALTLYLYILIAHWLVFLVAAEPEPTSVDVPETAGEKLG
jgi:alpha-1,2-mannosyltransferase